MEPKIVVINKKTGQTPLECIQELKKEHSNWKHLPMTYAGRLDPLARGVLLILIGDECLKKDEYLALPKEYELTVLFGFATDTYDVMGKVTEGSNDETPSPQSVSMGHSPLAGGEELTRVLSSFVGRITQAYPPYSSRTVGGKPLFQWAREDKLDEITIPSHDVFVDNIEILSLKSISGASLLKKISKDVGSVSGDFRQQEILELWTKHLADKKESIFQTVKLKIKCSSGVYVRSIANDLGKSLGIPALALDIVRTKIGDYLIK